MDSRAVYHSTKQVEIYFLLLKSSGLRLNYSAKSGTGILSRY